MARLHVDGVGSLGGELAVLGVGGDVGVGAREVLGAGIVEHGLTEAQPRQHKRVLVVLQHVVDIRRARLPGRHQGAPQGGQRVPPPAAVGCVVREDAAGGEQVEERLEDGRVWVALREQLHGRRRRVDWPPPGHSIWSPPGCSIWSAPGRSTSHFSSFLMSRWEGMRGGGGARQGRRLWPLWG